MLLRRLIFTSSFNIDIKFTQMSFSVQLGNRMERKELKYT